jgi:hypothetical protein
MIEIRAKSVNISVKIDSKARTILSSFPKEIQDYFQEIDAKCKQHDVKFRVSGGKSVYSGGGCCGGFFSDSPKELAIAINKPLKWVLATLVHEDSHFDQWLNRQSVWYNQRISRNFNNFFDWLQNIKNIKNPIESAKHVIALESDCERRSIKKIKKRWSHVISPETYAQSANAYMFSYLYMAQSRKWISNSVKIKNKCFYRNFPQKILGKFENLSEEYFELFRKYDNKCKSGPK